MQNISDIISDIISLPQDASKRAASMSSYLPRLGSILESSPVSSRSPSPDPDAWYPIAPSEERRFKLLYVPDPSRAMSREPAERNLAWTRQEIHVDQFERIKGLSGAVHECSVNGNSVSVLILDWLWLILMVNDFEDGRAFDVTFMSWEEFRNIVLDPPQHLEGWDILKRVDCILGGFDYSIGRCDPDNLYGMNAHLLATYEANVAYLACHTQFWPPIRLTRHSADKWTTIRHLQAIAQDSGRYVPCTRLLMHGEAIPPDAVLKRSHSDCGKHVRLPSADPACRAWESLDAMTSDGTFWMAQEYVPSLEWAGEWRVFLIGGMLIGAIHTYKEESGDWHGQETGAFLPLDEIFRIVRRAATPLDMDALRHQIVNPQSCTGFARRQGKREFENFVKQTWKLLVMRETKDTGAKPSLCVFCRMDIGIRIDPSGQSSPQYFVNEVERSLTTSLWLDDLSGKTVGKFRNTFAMVLKQWLMDIHNPYIV